MLNYPLFQNMALYKHQFLLVSGFFFLNRLLSHWMFLNWNNSIYAFQAAFVSSFLFHPIIFFCFLNFHRLTHDFPNFTSFSPHPSHFFLQLLGGVFQSNLLYILFIPNFFGCLAHLPLYNLFLFLFLLLLIITTIIISLKAFVPLPNFSIIIIIIILIIFSIIQLIII